MERKLKHEETAKLKKIKSAVSRVALLFPTTTGLDKSIFDATEGIRAYFKIKRFHDYDRQEQGNPHKVLRSCNIATKTTFIPTSVSLYRPQSGNGDPRFWIKLIQDHARDDDVIALAVICNSLYVFNLSQDVPIDEILLKRLELRDTSDGQAEIKEDFLLIDSTAASPTEKKELKNARIGQGKFRKKLDRYWESRCAVTGLAIKPLLIASHIKPWRTSSNHERLDCFNGLFLTPDLDKLFDKGLISFENNRKILMQPGADYELLGVKADMKLIRIEAQHKVYLECHRSMYGF